MKIKTHRFDLKKLFNVNRDSIKIWSLAIMLISTFFVGGLDLRFTALFVFALGGFAAAILVLMSVSRGKLVFPEGFRFYSIFLFAFAVSLLWSRDQGYSTMLFVLYAAGGLFWLGMFNAKRWFPFSLWKIISVLTILFLGLFILNNKLPNLILPLGPASLIRPATLLRKHSHLGDVWVLTAIFAFSRFTTRRKLSSLFFFLFSIGLIYFSQSRSAYLALAFGMAYIMWKYGFFKLHPWLSRVAILITVVAFVLVSSQKSVLMSRPYYFQAIAGLIENPLGVGVGNFKIISADKMLKWSQFNGFSVKVHNIFLEFLVGMGVLGLSFLLWFVQVTKSLLKNKKNQEKTVYTACFIALAVNFLFDTTYFIPTMVWIWFAVLGMAQSTKEKSGPFSKIFVGLLVLLLFTIGVVSFVSRFLPI